MQNPHGIFAERETSMLAKFDLSTSFATFPIYYDFFISAQHVPLKRQVLGHFFSLAPGG